MYAELIRKFLESGVDPSPHDDAACAAERREKVMNLYKDGYAFILGNKTTEMEWSDHEIPFRQNSTFLYVTGSFEADCCCVLDFKKKEYHLFVPRLPDEYAVWLGKISTLAEIKEKYGCDGAHYVDELSKFWGEREPGVVHVVSEKARKKCGALEHEGFTVESEEFQYDLAECRLIKCPHEVIFLAKSMGNLKLAIEEAMRNVKVFEKGADLAGVIGKYSGKMGTGILSFNTITAVGTSASTLHYVSHEDKLERDKTVLLDCGIEYKQYASDCTRTFPCGGKYTELQRKAYEIVLQMNTECIAMCKPGVQWENVHAHALRVMLEGFRKNGLVDAKESIEEQLRLDVINMFMPHGLGHLIGLDDHDVGGYPRGVSKIPRLSYGSLRARRELKPGMLITVEPGMYFVEPLINAALKDERAKHLNLEKIREWREAVGGIRIEDVVLITEEGGVALPAPPKDIEGMLALINHADAN